MKRWFGKILILIMPTLLWTGFALASQCAGDQTTLGIKINGQTCIGGSGHNVIFDYLSLIIGWAIRLLGAAVVLGIVVGGFQYVIAAGNPEAIKSAKKRIFQAVLGLILFILMYGILKALGVDAIA